MTKLSITKPEKSLIFILVMVGALGTFYFRGLFLQNKLDNIASKNEATRQNLKSQIFNKIDLQAASAIVFDPAKNEAIYTLHSIKSRPIASITKIMTALVALDQVPAGTIIPISKQALSQEGDNGLYLDEKWLLHDLVKFMLVISSNDAAKAISSQLNQQSKSYSFIDEMNKKAADLGLTNTNFSDETGLDLNAQKAGAYSSAQDIATLAGHLFEKYPEIFGATASPEIELKSESAISSHKIKNSNILVGSIPSIKASKTGFTNLAGGNLVVVFEVKPGHNLIAVVLGSTYDGRFSDMQKLIKASSDYFTLNKYEK